MKFHSRYLALPLSLASFLLIACDSKEEAVDANERPELPDLFGSDNSRAPNTSPQPVSKPKVNVAKLNKDLVNALSFNQPGKALAAIEAGADPHAKNRYGLPLIFTAAQSGNSDIIQALVAKGANPNEQIGTTHNTDGVGYAGTQDGTPLGYAAQKANLDTMQALLATGADINGGGLEGTTPLTLAVDSGKLTVVKWLIASGAKDKGGAALKKISMILNPDPERQQIIELLKQQGQ